MLDTMFDTVKTKQNETTAFASLKQEIDQTFWKYEQTRSMNKGETILIYMSFNIKYPLYLNLWLLHLIISYGMKHISLRSS